MRSYRNLLILASLAFIVFSAVNGVKYEKLREEMWTAGRYSFAPAPAAKERDAARRARIELRQDKIHSLVKPTSIAYFLLCLGFFVRVWSTSSWRKLALVGAFVSLAMILWSLLLGPAVSFDEVYPAWIAAAVVLLILHLVVLPRGAAQEKAAGT